ncbi:methylamine utilization protein MauE [Geobacter sp. OR-1]|uniref:MauE/DoxX family redox-associated membrane protein n=1 Tax=Geobacter sp. OR-1 TaxID=1266765 RepID=UPI000542F780|nr:MauE/DoxX family redox-associated membrane protein [Geobacter sp. OR-1]GAM10139.1 methylamine utilization protein MauE [Geobacter sp. OR-1]
MTGSILKHGIAIVRIVLGAIFLYAGVVKAGDTKAFAGSIEAYRLLPYFGNYLAASILPWVEIICGVLLVTGWRAKAGATVTILLNLVFIVAMASAVARGLEIDCGCFRQGAKDPPLLAIGRDILFLVMAGLVLLQDRLTANK